MNIKKMKIVPILIGSILLILIMGLILDNIIVPTSVNRFAYAVGIVTGVFLYYSTARFSAMFDAIVNQKRF